MRVVSLVALVLACAALSGPTPAQQAPDTRPNVLFVLTDDQPKETMLAMPQVKARIRDRGMTVSNAYVTQSTCCPSRVSTLRGQYPHNTGVWNNNPPQGGAQTFRQSGRESDTVATRLRKSGYATALVGKYLNGYDASYKPPGWMYWYGKADASTPGQRVRVNDQVIDFAGQPGNWGDRYEDEALGFLDRNTNSSTDEPFALFFWTNQPHLRAADHAERYSGLYRGETLPPKSSFDEANVSDKPAYIRNMGRIGSAERATLNEWRRNQLRSVRQVDDTVGKMLDLLARRGELDNTFVVYTTDNSTHMGEHRYFDEHGAKSTPYEEAANVPYFVRGPGIPAGETTREIVTNNDTAPTFLRIAGLQLPRYADGRNARAAWKGRDTARVQILHERPDPRGYPAPAYSAVITKTKTYVEYETGDRELYDRVQDPHQLKNAYDPANPPLVLTSKLDDLKGCAADSCRAAENRP